MSEMIERVARAMWEQRGRKARADYPTLPPLEAWDADNGAVAKMNGIMEEARAAIEAMRSPAVAMLEAGSEAMKGREIHGPAKFATLQVGYLAMISAALADDEKAVTP